MATPIATPMPSPADGALYRLLAWLSPAFPVGAYSYSHGIEYAVEAGLVTDAAALSGWVGAIVEAGAGRVDAMLLAAAWRAVSDGDEAQLLAVAELAGALRGTAEQALESRAQGAAFLATVCAAWPEPALARWRSVIAAAPRPPAYAVAVGVAAAAAGIALRPTLIAYAHAFAANLVSAGVRLIPLGQTDGQRVIAALEPAIVATVDGALNRPLGEIGAATPMVEWTSMQHETQYTRLFRS